MEIDEVAEAVLEGFEPEDSGTKRLSDDEIQEIVSSAVDDAVDFIESTIAPARIKAQRYFDGKCDLATEAGRSKVVMTKVRDTVRQVKPSLMRVFLSSGRPVEYLPRGPEDVQAAEQATVYAHVKFQELNGFRVLSDAFHDALVKKTGIVKVYYEDSYKSEIHTFTGLDENQFMAVIMTPDVEVLEHSETVEGDFVTHDVKIVRKQSNGDICFASVPPEEFFIDENARSIDDFYVCGHRTEKRVGDLVEMGFDFDDVVDLGLADVTTDEADERRGYSPDHEDSSADLSMRKVTLTEAYMRIDVDGAGVPVLHRILLGGKANKLLHIEPFDDAPFAIFEVDPEPHAFFGRSVADLLIDDQDAATSVMRGILDNVAMVNNPRLGVLEGQVELDDVMNNEIGAVIRMKNPNALMPIATPFAAAQTLVALQYMDEMSEAKTGVSRASMGLDADALQNTTATAANLAAQGGSAQIEVMARNLAEGGMRRLFSLMLGLIVKHADAPQFARINGEFTSVDPRVWDTGMDLGVNIGLGTGREQERAAAYREVLGLQMQVYSQYGPQNGVVSLTNIRNTVTDMMASSGIRNSERYFKPITPEYEQQLAQQAAQAAQGQPGGDPNAAFLQAEQMKAQTRAQTDMMRVQLDAQKAVMEDDRKRDEMFQNMQLKNAELQGKFGLQANEQVIRAEQERQRQFMPQQGR